MGDGDGDGSLKGFTSVMTRGICFISSGLQNACTGHISCFLPLSHIFGAPPLPPLPKAAPVNLA